jgi:hypothetical protein
MVAVLWRGLQILLAAGLIAWTALAIHFQVAPPLRYGVFALLAGVALAILRLIWSRRWRQAWLTTAALLAVVVLWWSMIAPREDRDWRPEVAHNVTSSENGGTVVLDNVRNFGWVTETDATERWERRTVDPDGITSVDMFLSVWDSPEIAHTLVSFGFEDGQHIVFSTEIRKEKGEDFSSIGGFFRQFEQVLIAADERDIVRLRTDVRGEPVPVVPRPRQRSCRTAALVQHHHRELHHRALSPCPASDRPGGAGPARAAFGPAAVLSARPRRAPARHGA